MAVVILADLEHGQQLSIPGGWRREEGGGGRESEGREIEARGQGQERRRENQEGIAGVGTA